MCQSEKWLGVNCDADTNTDLSLTQKSLAQSKKS